MIYIIIYLLSCFISYRYIQIAHSKDGIYYQKFNTEKPDIFLMFCPGINTIFCLAWIIDYPKKSIKNYNNFFKIKT